MMKKTPEAPERVEKEVTITTIYDDCKSDPRLKIMHGFSCLVKVGGREILFDTGGDPSVLLSNMRSLNINPEGIDIIVLSHIHSDHVGGLDGMLKGMSQVDHKVLVYMPESFPDDFKRKVGRVKIVEVGTALKICDQVYLTGELETSIKGIKEQSLIVKTEKGLAVITGCAHPGIVHVLEEVEKMRIGNIYLVMGGFHLSRADDSEIKDIIKEFRDLGVKKVAPSHCSGSMTRELFEEEYGDDFIPNGAGMRI